MLHALFLGVIKWLEKECIFQNFDQNKVEYISIKTLIEIKCILQHSESKASASASPADLARRAWLRRTRDNGGTTIRFRIFRRRGGGTWPKSIFFQNSIQNKVAGERIELNFDQNFDQNKVVQKEM